MNKLSITRSSAGNIACVAAIARTFFGIVIDSPEIQNAGWISIVIGGILTIPLFACIGHLYALSPESPLEQMNVPWIKKAIPLVFILTSLLDGGISARCISNSASYVAFNHAIRFYLLIPLFLSALWAVYLSGDAIGASARLWIRVFPLFMLIVILFQLREYRWTWLTPILGSGHISILNSAVDSAGWISGTAGILLISSEDDNNDRKWNAFKLPVLITLISVILVILRQMMAPSMLSSDNRSRMFHFDAMLSNGRAPLMLQLPLIVMWFVSMVNLLVFDCFIASAYMQSIFPKLNSIWCGAITIVVMAALSMSVFTDRIAESVFSSWQFVINSTGIVVVMFVIWLKGGRKACANAV